MKKYGRIFLVLAILFGLAAQAQATSYDPTNLVPPTAQGLVRMNQGGAGDALVGEFYRATVGTNFQGELDNANFLTYVSIINTSNDWVAAHVRLRTGRYSIEAIDFPILLSPNDVFWFQFEGVGTNSLTGVRIFSQDTKTLVRSNLPVDSNGIWSDNLSNSILKTFNQLPDDQKDVKELAIGYIEVIGLWKLRIEGSDASVSEGLLPASYTFNSLQRAFYANGRAPLDPISNTSVFVVPRDLGNVLTGQVFMGDFTNGLYTGYGMTALADFRTNCPDVRHRDGQIRGYRAMDTGAIVYLPLGSNNAGTLFDPAYKDPDWATSFGPTWNDGDDWTRGGRTVSGSYSLDEVDDALAKQKITSTYFNGGFRVERTTFTMATLTFPTKYLHFFARVGDGLIPDPWPVGRPGDAAAARSSLDVAGELSSINLFGRIFDLEERAPFDPVSPQLLTNLQWEVNCLPIGALSRAKLSEFCFLTHPEGPIDVDGSFFAGWFELQGFGLITDPRNSALGVTDGYRRTRLPLLHCLADQTNASAFGLDRLIPVLVQTLDFEFANFLHARSFVPAWDNPNNCETQVEFPCASPNASAAPTVN